MDPAVDTNMMHELLTDAERAHLARGGRVFLVQRISGPRWRVLSLTPSTCKVLLRPADMDGYSDHTRAVELAQATANLAVDAPLVRDLDIDDAQLDDAVLRDDPGLAADYFSLQNSDTDHDDD